MLSIAAISTLVLLSKTAGAQLLFPVNTQLPFDLTKHSGPGGAGLLWSETRPPRVAIIGAGAAGSSAAYFLSHFAGLQGMGLETEVTVFESSDYVGGRSTVIRPWEDDPWATPGAVGDSEDGFEAPIECGASIFVEANKNLQKAARIFNLTLVEHGGEEGTMAIWDGSRFVYAESKGWGWGYFDLAKMFWRYGRSPLKVRSLVKATVANFLELYSPSFAARGPFDSLASYADATNLSLPASFVAKDYFDKHAVSPLFSAELVSAATQVNYGTPVSQIHGVGALVSLAATGAVAVKGGNRKVFENFLGSSGATLRLGEQARVTEILKLDAAKGQRPQWVVKAPGGGGTFDAVIIAAPFHQTGIHIVNSPVSSLIPPQKYVRLHVTFVITNTSTPQASYFNLPPTTSMPNSVFGTFDTDSPNPPTFNSLNYLKTLPASIGQKFGDGQWHVVKMFSAQPLEPKLLNELYGEGNVGKTFEKVFLAYPKLDPIEDEKILAPIRPDESLFYVNGFERIISTMETSTVASFNVVSLLLQDLFGYTTPSSWAEWEE